MRLTVAHPIRKREVIKMLPGDGTGLELPRPPIAIWSNTKGPEASDGFLEIGVYFGQNGLAT